MYATADDPNGQVLSTTLEAVTAGGQARRRRRARHRAAPGGVRGAAGHHPLGPWLDNTGEALAMMPRPGNAGSNTAADHLSLPDRALRQIPDRWRNKKVLGPR